MKKTILFCGAAMMLLATACSGNKNGANDTDSLAGVVVEDTTLIEVSEDTMANGQVVGDTTAVEAGQIVEGVVADGKEAAKEKGKEIVDAAKEKGKEAVQEAKDKGKEAVDAAKQKGADALNKAADKLR